jgi:hypothetical protein
MHHFAKKWNQFSPLMRITWAHQALPKASECPSGVVRSHFILCEEVNINLLGKLVGSPYPAHTAVTLSPNPGLLETASGSFDSSRHGGAMAIPICIFTIATNNGNSKRISDSFCPHIGALRTRRRWCDPLTLSYSLHFPVSEDAGVSGVSRSSSTSSHTCTDGLFPVTLSVIGTISFVFSAQSLATVARDPPAQPDGFRLHRRRTASFFPRSENFIGTSSSMRLCSPGSLGSPPSCRIRICLHFHHVHFYSVR